MADSLLPPHLLSSNSSIPQAMDECFRSSVSVAIFAATFTTSLLLLPLFILVLYVGLERWKRHRSSPNHSDLFLFHSTVMYVNSVLGFSLFFFGGYVHRGLVMLVGLYIWTATAAGQAMLHLLMCVERYFAVLRPIRYLEVRGAAGARIRTASIGCVWLLCVGWATVVFLSDKQAYLILYSITIGFNVTVIFFCSVSVLLVLKRPGPGSAPGPGPGPGRNRVDRTKQRASCTIAAVMAALVVRFSWNLINGLMYSSGILNPRDLCGFLMSDIWFDLPSNLLLPLMFLQQRHRLCCWRSTEPEGDEN